MARRRYRKSAFPSIRKWFMKSGRLLADEIFSPNDVKRTPEKEAQVNSFVLANLFLGFFEPACWLIPLVAAFRKNGNNTRTKSNKPAEDSATKIVNTKSQQNAIKTKTTETKQKLVQKKSIDINHSVFKELNALKDNITKNIKVLKNSMEDYKKNLEIQKQKIKEINLNLKNCNKDEILQLTGQKITENKNLIYTKLDIEKLRTEIAKAQSKIEKIKLQEYKLKHSLEDIETFSIDDFKTKLENGEI